MPTMWALLALYKPIDTHVVSWTLRKPIGICMGDLILGIILYYIVSANCFLYMYT